MNNIKEVNNIYKIPEINSILLSKSSKIYLDKLREHAFTICRKTINESYIEYAIDTFTNGLLYVKDGKYLGFCIWKLDKSNTNIPNKTTASNTRPVKSIHILLICADKNDYHLGNIILQDVDEYCKLNFINYITLTAIPDRIPFYKRYGFELINDPLKENYMIKKAGLMQLTRTKQTRKIKRN